MRAAVVAALAVLVCVPWARSARADGIDADLRSYYGGEMASAYLVGTTGVAAAAGGAYLVTRDSSIARGLGGAWLAMGSVETIGAVVYAIQVGDEIRRYRAELASDPSAYRADEIEHLHGTSSRFVVYRAVELSLALAGAAAAAYGIASHRGPWEGAGIGVSSLSLPFFLLDTCNDTRASRYLDEVRRFEPAVGFVPADARHPWMLSLAGRF